MSDKEEITCKECEAEFIIEHDEVDEPKYCPFCGADLVLHDHSYEEEEEEI